MRKNQNKIHWYKTQALYIITFLTNIQKDAPAYQRTYRNISPTITTSQSRSYFILSTHWAKFQSPKPKSNYGNAKHPSGLIVLVDFTAVAELLLLDSLLCTVAYQVSFEVPESHACKYLNKSIPISRWVADKKPKSKHPSLKAAETVAAMVDYSISNTLSVPESLNCTVQ